MRKVIGFYHVAMMCDWQTLMKKQLAKLQNSNLIKESTLYLCAVGPKREYNKINHLHSRIVLNHISDNLLDYEHPTIEKLHELSKQEDFAAYYIHTKGVSLDIYKNDKKKFRERFHKPNMVKKFGKLSYNQIAKNTLHWRVFLDHFTIQRWTDALITLDKHDCAGPLWIKEGFKHFSGNFWWSNSEYLRTLESVYTFPFTKKDYRFRSEAWIGQKENVKAKSLSSLRMHYYQSFPPRVYK